MGLSAGARLSHDGFHLPLLDIAVTLPYASPDCAFSKTLLTNTPQISEYLYIVLRPSARLNRTLSLIQPASGLPSNHCAAR